MTKWTLCAVSIACLVAASLPVAVTKPEIVYVEKPKPLMWESCDPQMKIERERICRARPKSARVKL